MPSLLLVLSLGVLARWVTADQVMCDVHHACSSSDFTCCKLATDQWGCCPVGGQCCADKMHCCPRGYDCDTKKDVCVLKGKYSTNKILKAHPVPLQKSKAVKEVRCGDSTGACPAGNTCCPNNKGYWACCSLPQAVCCADGLHCCDAGFTCHPQACVKHPKYRTGNRRDSVEFDEFPPVLKPIIFSQG